MRFLPTTLLPIGRLAAPSYGQRPISHGPDAIPSVIGGIVADRGGDYIPRAPVSIVGNSDQLKFSSVSNANGSFTHENLETHNIRQLTISESRFGGWDSPEKPLQSRLGVARLPGAALRVQDWEAYS
jgi:hypothetical protein